MDAATSHSTGSTPTGSAPSSISTSKNVSCFRFLFFRKLCIFSKYLQFYSDLNRFSILTTGGTQMQGFKPKLFSSSSIKFLYKNFFAWFHYPFSLMS